VKSKSLCAVKIVVGPQMIMMLMVVGIIMYDRTAVANKWWAEATQETREDYGKDFFNMPMRGI